ncbi:MAG TPA: hydrogenase maturation protease [Nitrospiria bacterium]|nr:hydrogenase maturation protease [Nitrospiria bacterium]
MASVAVLGLGNTLMQDDGVGAKALDELERCYRLPESVRLIRSDAPMARLAAELDGVGRLIVVDAVRGGRPPGSVYRVERAQLVAAGRRAGSSHGMGLADLLDLLEALGRCPDVRIIGVEIGGVEIGGVEIGGVEAGKADDAGSERSDMPSDELSSELSGLVAAALPRAAEAVADELLRLGVVVEEREAARHHA